VAKATTIDEYLTGLPDERRGPMAQIRAAVREGAPEATETIAYGMPAFRSHGRQFMVSFDAYKAHYSLFPASEAVEQACGDELTPYLAGKGTIRFPVDRPLPIELITRIARVRFAENAAKAADRSGS
jgi:uncharacterized protein YdhG (YjbR/CyaY superfamily)